jgi:hypothetical protein
MLVLALEATIEPIPSELSISLRAPTFAYITFASTTLGLHYLRLHHLGLHYLRLHHLGLHYLRLHYLGLHYLGVHLYHLPLHPLLPWQQQQHLLRRQQ